MTGPVPAIVGVGYSEVGRATGRTLLELSAQASRAALADAGVDARRVDGIVAHCFPHQMVAPSVLGSTIGVDELSFMSCSVDGPAFSMAVSHAVAAVTSGACTTCLVLRPVLRAGAAASNRAEAAQFDMAGTMPLLTPYGYVGGPHWAALYMRRYIELGCATEADFAQFAAVQRAHARRNPDALLTDPLSPEDYLAARMIADPLRLLDCDYPVDAASALLVVAGDRAEDIAEIPVYMAATSFAALGESEFPLVPDMQDHAMHRAARRLWQSCDFRPDDIDVAGLYDGFSFITLQWLEALGICEEGAGGKFVSSGATDLGGSCPVNTDGGAANVGRRHGANYYIEVVRQLRGECGPRQVRGARTGVATNAVGVFAGCSLLTTEPVN